MGLRAVLDTGDHFPVLTPPGFWSLPPLYWEGSHPILEPAPHASVRHREVNVPEDGEYRWRATPIFLAANATTRLALYVFDNAGDLAYIEDLGFVTSGQTVSGTVHLSQFNSAAFAVGDDVGEDIGQYLEDGSVFEWPTTGLRVGSIALR